jgi:hypothetical protein
MSPEGVTTPASCSQAFIAFLAYTHWKDSAVGTSPSKLAPPVRAEGLQVAAKIHCLMRDGIDGLPIYTPFPPPMASVQQRQATSMVATANSNSGKQESASTSISKAASAGVWKV